MHLAMKKYFFMTKIKYYSYNLAFLPWFGHLNRQRAPGNYKWSHINVNFSYKTGKLTISWRETHTRQQVLSLCGNAIKKMGTYNCSLVYIITVHVTPLWCHVINNDLATWYFRDVKWNLKTSVSTLGRYMHYKFTA